MSIERIISSKSPRFFLRNASTNEPMPVHIQYRRKTRDHIVELSEEFYTAMFDLQFENLRDENIFNTLIGFSFL